MVLIAQPKAIIVDVEGTTTSVRFWSEALVPFIKAYTERCLKDKWNAPEVVDVVDRLRRRTKDEIIKGVKVPAIADTDASREEIIDSVVKNVIFQMDNKRFGSSIKQIQIIVCMYGYQKKQLQGHVFKDVSYAFHNWKTKHKIKIYTYSSSLGLAQKLMFACSNSGNLTPLINDYFDTEVMGSKTNSESFFNISEQIKEKTSNILFISDNPKELRAAAVAECNVLLAIRAGNKELSESEKEGYVAISNFLDVHFG